LAGHRCADRREIQTQGADEHPKDLLGTGGGEQQTVEVQLGAGDLHEVGHPLACQRDAAFGYGGRQVKGYGLSSCIVDGVREV
jgi:hypothetical protein